MTGAWPGNYSMEGLGPAYDHLHVNYLWYDQVFNTMADVVQAPMKLFVAGWRIKHGRRRIKVITIHRSYTAKDCSCSVVSKPPEDPSLELCVEVFGRGGSEFLKFCLRKHTKISLVGTSSPIGNPYLYKIKWTLGKIKYSLKVCKLSLISQLISLNNTFKVKHNYTAISKGKFNSYSLLNTHYNLYGNKCLPRLPPEKNKRCCIYWS